MIISIKQILLLDFEFDGQETSDLGDALKYYRYEDLILVFNGKHFQKAYLELSPENLEFNDIKKMIDINNLLKYIYGKEC